MGAALLGFLKALPELVSVIKSLGNEITKMRNASIERKVDKIEADINTIIARVKNENDREKLLILAGDLNRARRGEL